MTNKNRQTPHANQKLENNKNRQTPHANQK